MADSNARMLQLIGSTADWTANDLVLHEGEIGLEISAGSVIKGKVGDGAQTFSQLAYTIDGGLVDRVAQVEADLAAHIADIYAHRDSLMNWKGIWQGGDYLRNDVVRDGDWTMIALQGTSERPAPQPDPAGPFYVSDVYGTLAFTFPTAAEAVYITGNRFTFNKSGFFLSYRFWVPDNSGNFVYEVWGNADQAAGNNVVKLLGPFVPSTTGWNEVPYNGIVRAGVAFDLVVVARASTSPNTFTGNWDVKNENGSPSEGEASFQSTATEIRIHKTDQNDVDRTAQLESVEEGGTLEFAGVTWTITLVDIRGSHVRYSIEPDQGRPSEDNRDITFTWGSAAPIPHAIDSGYYSAAPDVLGFEGTTYPPSATNNNAYGVDIQLQEADVSEDWELVSFSG